MNIDLLSPFWGSLIAGLIALGVVGIIKFSIIAHRKKLIEDDFFRLRDAMESLQQKHQENIEHINKTHKEEKIKAIEQAIEIYSKEFYKILDEYKHIKPSHDHKSVNDTVRDAYVYGNKSKSDENS